MLSRETQQNSLGILLKNKYHFEGNILPVNRLYLSELIPNECRFNLNSPREALILSLK